ncbi:zinc knuckle CX2CX4HX4C containing protein [Tanacetum coccineum]
MKDLVANKTLAMKDEDVRINRRCSAILLNQLPSKEKNPGSFILPCSIGRLDFNNALADLGASISIMPFSMYKRLGKGKLETIKMKIELADNSKCIPKGVIRNLLIKIDKFILPIDFIILDVLEDFRIPVKSNMIAEEDELTNIESDLFTYTTNTCESCQILAVDTNLFTYEVVIQETYDEITHKCCLTAHEAIGENSKPILGIPQWEVDETRKEKILTEHWKKRFGVHYDDSNDFYDLDQCGDGRNNEIRERIIHKLHEEWFKGTSNDENDIEGIINYLEPTSYDGFVDLDEEEYNKRRCRLLGMPYIEPLPIIIEQVKITQYSLGPGEVYMKLEVSNTEELPQTRNNVTTIRSNIMEEVFKNN